MKDLPLPDNFTSGVLKDFARAQIAFGRLEYIIMLSIKDLAKLLGNASSLLEGLEIAARERSFMKMLEKLQKLHIQKFGKCHTFNQWYRRAKKLADNPTSLARNDITHGCWTYDQNNPNTLLCLRVSYRKKFQSRLINVKRDEIAKLHENIKRVWSELDHQRSNWH